MNMTQLGSTISFILFVILMTILVFCYQKFPGIRDTLATNWVLYFSFGIVLTLAGALLTGYGLAYYIQHGVGHI